jgi:hypothetical protein
VISLQHFGIACRVIQEVMYVSGSESGRWAFTGLTAKGEHRRGT